MSHTYNRFTHGVTLGEVLKGAGYRTLASGKHHSRESLFDRGFDRYFGLLDGANNHFNPGHPRAGEPKPAQKLPGRRSWALDERVVRPYTPPEKRFYSTDAFTQRALDQIPPADAGKLKANFTGLFKKTRSKHNMFYLHRTNPIGNFEAIFTAALSVDGQTAIGTLINTAGMHGTMLMVRREALSRYKHLVESDTIRQTEPAGTKPASEIGVDGIPRGVKALEASLNKERMAQAVEMFEKLDKNKDGKITDKEVPPAQFQNKAWIQANINGDMILTWEEELIWQYNYQKKKAEKSDLHAEKKDH